MTDVPKNAEEWRALVLDLQRRVEFLENAHKRRRRGNAWNGELADVWIATYKGRPPAFVFQQAKKVVQAYGWERAKPVFEYYFRKTEIDYVSIPKCVMGAFEILEEQMKGNGASSKGGRRDPIDVAADGMLMARRMRAEKATGADRGDVSGGNGETDRGSLPLARRPHSEADRRA